MTRNEQKSLIKEVARKLAGEILWEIDRGRIPEEWNGLQLRWLMADKIRKDAPINSKRLHKKYLNTVLENNL